MEIVGKAHMPSWLQQWAAVFCLTFGLLGLSGWSLVRAEDLGEEVQLGEEEFKDGLRALDLLEQNFEVPEPDRKLAEQVRGLLDRRNNMLAAMSKGTKLADLDPKDLTAATQVQEMEKEVRAFQLKKTFWSEPRFGTPHAAAQNFHHYGIPDQEIKSIAMSEVCLLENLGETSEARGNAVHIGPGLFVTNDHVLRGRFKNQKITLVQHDYFPSLEAAAKGEMIVKRVEDRAFKVLYTDPTYDLAVIRVDVPPENRLAWESPVRFSNEPFHAGERVVLATYLPTFMGETGEAKNLEMVFWISTGRVKSGLMGTTFVDNFIVGGGSGTPVYVLGADGKLYIKGHAFSGKNYVPDLRNDAIVPEYLFNEEKISELKRSQITGVSSYARWWEALGLSGDELRLGRINVPRKRYAEYLMAQADAYLTNPQNRNHPMDASTPRYNAALFLARVSSNPHLSRADKISFLWKYLASGDGMFFHAALHALAEDPESVDLVRALEIEKGAKEISVVVDEMRRAMRTKTEPRLKIKIEELKTIVDYKFVPNLDEMKEIAALEPEERVKRVEEFKRLFRAAIKWLPRLEPEVRECGLVEIDQTLIQFQDGSEADLEALKAELKSVKPEKLSDLFLRTISTSGTPIKDFNSPEFKAAIVGNVEGIMKSGLLFYGWHLMQGEKSFEPTTEISAAVLVDIPETGVGYIELVPEKVEGGSFQKLSFTLQHPKIFDDVLAAAAYAARRTVFSGTVRSSILMPLGRGEYAQICYEVPSESFELRLARQFVTTGSFGEAVTLLGEYLEEDGRLENKPTSRAMEFLESMVLDPLEDPFWILRDAYEHNRAVNALRRLSMNSPVKLDQATEILVEELRDRLERESFFDVEIFEDVTVRNLEKLADQLKRLLPAENSGIMSLETPIRRLAATSRFLQGLVSPGLSSKTSPKIGWTTYLPKYYREVLAFQEKKQIPLETLQRLVNIRMRQVVRPGR